MSTQASWRLQAGRLLLASFVFAAVSAFTVGAGLTDAYGTAGVVQANVGAWSDGAAPDTFWDSRVVDVPGLSVFSVHCHGQMHYDLQYGAAGPHHGNRCLAAMNAGITASTGELDAYMFLPIGNKVLYRCNVNDSPWIYFIGDVIYAPVREPSGPPTIMDTAKGHCRTP